MSALVCTACQTHHPLTAPIWRCSCGGLLDIAHTPSLDPAALAERPPSLWRYREALALAPNAVPISLGEGYTPLIPLELDSARCLCKLDQLFPTGSFKDRGASVLISQAAALGIDLAVEDSSGNAGSAIAAYCARASIACHIYVPAATSPAKLAQIEAYDATLHRVPGTRQDTADAALTAAGQAYYASHTWNPFFLQGTKTWAYEVCEQLDWRAPDVVVLPVGNGTLLLGAALGFSELRDLGLIAAVPRLVGVQIAGCAPLADALAQGLAEPAQVTPEPTIAEGIAIAAPLRGRQILAAVRRSHGALIAVTDDEVIAAQQALARQGLYVEPTAAVAPAGLVRLQHRGALPPDATVVTALTGHGLKATKA